VVPESEQLKEYREKRDFTKTSEPTGGEQTTGPQARPDQVRFVVQQHDATRMHYDFRLEVNGVLKSWAVPEGPCTDPQVKRLAIETEDHPMEYLTFEGNIPKGEYGAGPVIVWDWGTYVNIRGEKRKPFTMEEAYEQGLIEVRLDGEKLKGAYALVRTKFRDAKNSWLMVKMKDAHIDPDLDIVKSYPQSVKSGKIIEEVAGEQNQKPFPVALQALSDELREQLKANEFPGWQEPMLATPADKPFNKSGWIYEQKLDGQRCLIFRKSGQVQLVSRNKLLITGQYPELVEALQQMGQGDFVVDGEIVSFENGKPSFEQMQKRMHVNKPGKDLLQSAPVLIYLFDILFLEGYVTTALPQIARKEILRGLLEYADPIRYMEHQQGDGAQLLAEACKNGLEGIIAKEAKTAYQHRRSQSWLKFKCVRSEEMVVGGFTEGNAGMRGFGSLLVGYYAPGDERLQFAGGIGTGFNDKTMRDMKAKLAEIPTAESPFAQDDLLPTKDVHWVEPKLVVQVGYGEWTKANKLRHPRYLGLRVDKDPREVMGPTTPDDYEPPVSTAWDPEESQPEVRTLTEEATRVVEGHRIKLTNLEKVLFPDGITKGQIIDYYEQIAPHMLPHLVNRPLNLERFPSGIGEKGFYHKETPNYFPDYIELVQVKTSETETQMQSMANNAATLVYLAQMAALTLHPWLSRKQQLGMPDKIVFDLDPSTEDSWDVVKEGALDLREMLRQMGLPSFVMTTGSRGLHVAVPIKPDHEYEAITLFSKAVCRKLERNDPKFTTQFRKEKRKGRVFLDHLRNRYAHTSVAPYTVRARPGATIAAPLNWDELDDPGLTPQTYTILNIFDRLRKMGGDPWKEFFEFAAPLPDFDTIQKVLA
jgi:bifunctional non-homologous end joining protein LigD